MEEMVDAKKQHKREKIGVIVFIAAIIGIFIAVFAYISISHSLDLTASDIDVQVGQLDGYLSIVFEGSNTSRTSEKQESLLKITPDFFKDSSTSKKVVKDGTKDAFKSSDPNVSIENATIENVEHYYEEKGATTCKIKCDDYNAYNEGEIFERGNWKVGAITIPQEVCNEQFASSIPTQRIKNVQHNIYMLRYVDEADIIVVIAPDQKIIKYLNDINCALCQHVDDNITDQGRSDSTGFTMREPDKLKIGSIVVTPAKMFSGDVYTKIEVNNKEE